MRNKTITLLLMILNSYWGFCQPKMVFTKTQYNFRVIGKDSVVTTSFKFMNVGNGDLEITKIYTSCHCTKAVPTKNIISPNEYGEIIVVFKAMGTGKFKEDIIICNKGQRKPLYLKIKGKAIE